MHLKKYLNYLSNNNYKSKGDHIHILMVNKFQEWINLSAEKQNRSDAGRTDKIVTPLPQSPVKISASVPPVGKTGTCPLGMYRPGNVTKYCEICYKI